MKSLFKKIIVTTLLVCGSWFSIHAQSNVVPDDIEFQILKSIYDDLGGTSWTTKTNWPSFGNWPATATSAQFGTWYGVTVTNGDITSLNLTSNNLIGPLPSGIVGLTRLVNLNMAINRISGPLPDLIGNMLALSIIRLNNNQLSGPIPDTFVQLTNSTQIYLNNNQLNGELPNNLGSLSKLINLQLNDNKFTGSIPTSLGELYNLTSLWLHTNQLKGSIPTSLGDLNKLTELRLAGNQLSGRIPKELGKLTKLTNLILSSNQLSGPIPQELGSLINLGNLSLHLNSLTGEIPSSLGSLRQLGYLFLQGNQLKGNIPDTFGDLSNLITLYLQSNQLAGTLPASLGRLSNLQNLSVNDNGFKGSLPSTMNGMVQLKILMLYNNRFSGDISFLNLPELTQIQLHNNGFTGPFPETSGMPKLYYILATNNQLTSLPASLLGHTLMTYINVTNNELTFIPNFANQVNKANLTLTIQSNRLDFSHLEPLVGGGIKSVSVLTQKTINDQPTLNLTIGVKLFIKASLTGDFSTVTWEKQSANGQFALINTDQDNDPQTYTFTPATTADEGIYRWKMTNTKVTGVTLYSDPIAVKTPVRFALDNWAFQYKYDGRKRMTHKKVPGADWVYMVYDDRDRLVMTQDGEQRKANKWGFTKYDALNRPVITGIYTHTAVVDQATMQGEVNNFYPSDLPVAKAWCETVVGNAVGGNVHGYDNKSFPKVTDPSACLTITYYDNYNFLTDDEKRLYDYVENDVADRIVNGITYSQPDTANTGVIGQVTGTKVRKLDTYPYWFRTVSYYDEKYRSLQVITEDHIGELQRTTNLYDFVGKVLTSKTTTINQKPAWANAVNVRIEGDLVTPVTNNAQWASGVSSAEQLAANQDGWVEATVIAKNSNNNNHITFGFSVSDVNTDPTTITYSWRQMSQAAYVFEGTAQRSGGFPTVQGDVLRIERIGNKIYYKKNGVVMLTSPGTSTTALLYDNSLFLIGSTLLNPRSSFATANTKSITRLFDYDHAGRLMKTWHSVDEATPILLAHNEYNELGQLIDKKLHSTQAPEVADASRTYKQSTDYRYNIRGWLTSINNADLTQGSNNEDDNRMERDLFGMELAYEKPVTTLTTAADVEYNGNISAIMYSNNLALGTIKSNGYKFDYDPMNRLKESNFREKKTDWALPEFADEDENTLTAQSYSETGFDYDLNGNIKHLTRSGKGNTVMDELTYDYGASNPAMQSNQLLSVKDEEDRTQGFIDGNVAGNDYSYDANGNMVLDKNKRIMTSAGGAGITYNHLNLPEKVLKNTGDYIRYIYDATGRKLSQQVYNVSNVLKKRSDYAGEYFYENDTLKFINHEEGRIVMVSEGQPIAPEYQYHLKDHLGNVRTTFTTKEEVEESKATYEISNAEAEKSKYLNYDKVRFINHELYDHTKNGQATTPEGAYSQRLSGNDKEKIGLVRSLSVMPGDKLDIEVYAKYYRPVQGDQSAFATLMSAIISGVGVPAGTIIDGMGYAMSANNSLPFVSGISKTDDDPAAPKAYLNWAVFNRDYIQDLGKSGYKGITTDSRENGTNVDHDHLHPDNQIVIDEPGYVYIWLSNENEAAVEVYFDDFKVVHTKSPVVSTSDYYPYGLSFNEYIRENSLLNNYKYNGKELQDELNLGLYDYIARQYDPVLGRFTSVDPAADLMRRHSPYNYAFDNPLRFIDPDGMVPEDQTDPEKNKQEKQPNALESFLMDVFSAIAGAGSTVNQVFGNGEASEGDDFMTGVTLLATAPMEAEQMLMEVGETSEATVASKVDDVAKPIVNKIDDATKVIATKIDDVVKPTEAYNRAKHYGKTPTAAQRRSAGAKADEVLDHNPALMLRYYEGDPAVGEKPGYLMTSAERRASASDMTRMQKQPRKESDIQGGVLAKRSREIRKALGL